MTLIVSAKGGIGKLPLQIPQLKGVSKVPEKPPWRAYGTLKTMSSQQGAPGRGKSTSALVGPDRHAALCDKPRSLDLGRPQSS